MEPLVSSSLLSFDLRHFSPVKGETELSDDAMSPCALSAESAAAAVRHHLDCICGGALLAYWGCAKSAVFAWASAATLCWRAHTRSATSAFWGGLLGPTRPTICR